MLTASSTTHHGCPIGYTYAALDAEAARLDRADLRDPRTRAYRGFLALLRTQRRRAALSYLQGRALPTAHVQALRIEDHHGTTTLHATSCPHARDLGTRRLRARDTEGACALLAYHRLRARPGHQEWAPLLEDARRATAWHICVPALPVRAYPACFADRACARTADAAAALLDGAPGSPYPSTAARAAAREIAAQQQPGAAPIPRHPNTQ